MAAKRQSSDWATKPLDAKYLVDSGLLFEINRSILHLMGISMRVVEEDGKLSIILLDSRSKPEEAKFASTEALQKKLDRFMREFGDNQIDRRSQHLGWGTQPSTQYVNDGNIKVQKKSRKG